MHQAVLTHMSNIWTGEDTFLAQQNIARIKSPSQILGKKTLNVVTCHLYKPS